MLGSAALPLACASRVSALEEAPNSVPPPPPLRPPVATKSPARRWRAPASVPRAARGLRAMERGGWFADPQPPVEPADDGVVVDPGTAEEHLVEQRSARHLPE